MKERFAIPAAGAIIEDTLDGVRRILVQERRKENGGRDNGLIEIPAGKIREYESIFDALRREVREETGLTLTAVRGEDEAVRFSSGGYDTVSLLPFCVTENLCGGYSIILNTFICTASGTPVPSTSETANVRFVDAASLEAMLEQSPGLFYPMHINALRKYFAEYPVK